MTHQLVLVQSYERAVEHELCGEQLVCSVNLARGLALQQHHACVYELHRVRMTLHR